MAAPILRLQNSPSHDLSRSQISKNVVDGVERLHRDRKGWHLVLARKSHKLMHIGETSHRRTNDFQVANREQCRRDTSLAAVEADNDECAGANKRTNSKLEGCRGADDYLF